MPFLLCVEIWSSRLTLLYADGGGRGDGGGSLPLNLNYVGNIAVLYSLVNISFQLVLT